MWNKFFHYSYLHDAAIFNVFNYYGYDDFNEVAIANVYYLNANCLFNRDVPREYVLYVTFII